MFSQKRKGMSISFNSYQLLAPTILSHYSHYYCVCMGGGVFLKQRKLKKTPKIKWRSWLQILNCEVAYKTSFEVHLVGSASKLCCSSLKISNHSRQHIQEIVKKYLFPICCFRNRIHTLIENPFCLITPFPFFKQQSFCGIMYCIISSFSNM